MTARERKRAFFNIANSNTPAKVDGITVDAPHARLVVQYYNQHGANTERFFTFNTSEILKKVMTSIAKKLSEESPADKKIIHKGNPRYADSMHVPDGVFACSDALRQKHPQCARRWADVTCPKCLRRQVWGKPKADEYDISQFKREEPPQTAKLMGKRVGPTIQKMPSIAKCSECGKDKPIAYMYGGKEPLCAQCAERVLNEGANVTCTRCGATYNTDDLKNGQIICPECGGNFKIAKEIYTGVDEPPRLAELANESALASVWNSRYAPIEKQMVKSFDFNAKRVWAKAPLATKAAVIDKIIGQHGVEEMSTVGGIAGFNAPIGTPKTKKDEDVTFEPSGDKKVPILCPYCGAKFARAKEYYDHLKRHQRQIKEDVDIWNLKHPGMWNIFILKSRPSRWDYHTLNPQGGSFSMSSYPTAKQALGAALHTTAKDEEKVLFVQAVVPFGRQMSITQKKVTTMGDLRRSIGLKEWPLGFANGPNQINLQKLKRNKFNELKLSKLIKETTENPIDGRSKKSAVNWLYNNAVKVTEGIHSDDSWKPVNQFFNILRNNNINYTINDAQYEKNDKGVPTRKVWKFQIEFLTDKATEGKINGHLTAHGAGSVNDPLDRYDITVILG